MRIVITLGQGPGYRCGQAGEEAEGDAFDVVGGFPFNGTGSVDQAGFGLVKR